MITGDAVTTSRSARLYLRNGIKSSRAPGIAPKEPSDGERASAQGAVAFNCLKSKCGAGRVVAAVRRHQGADEILITPDQEQNESAHRHWTSDFARCSSAWRSRRDQSLSNTANSCLFSPVPASFRTNTTISREGNVPKRCR